MPETPKGRGNVPVPEPVPNPSMDWMKTTNNKKKKKDPPTNEPHAKRTRIDTIVGVAHAIPSNNRTESLLDPLHQALEEVHAIYSFYYLLLRQPQSRVLMQYTRSLALETGETEGEESVLLLYKTYLGIVQSLVAADATWNIAIRNVYMLGSNEILQNSPLNTLFADIMDTSYQVDAPLTRKESLEKWITEYMADPYIGEGGVPNSHVYTWSNLIKEEMRPDLGRIAQKYMDLIYFIDPSFPATKRALLPSHGAAQRILDDPQRLARVAYPAPKIIPADYGVIQENVFTALIAEIAASVIESKSTDLVRSEQLLKLLNVMPIEFVIRVMLDNPGLTLDKQNETLFKNVLRTRLGSTENPDAVYGPIEGRLERILDRVKTVYYLDPNDIWSNWAQVRNNKGVGPYEYQWSIIIPLLAAELRETNEQGVIQTMVNFLRGAYLACDPGTGKTLIALVILVLGNLITGNTNPTMIVLPPALVDEWIDAWKKFFKHQTRYQFPLFIYDHYAAKLVETPGHGLVAEEPIIINERQTFPRKFPPNAIIIVKRKIMEKFSVRYYDRESTEEKLSIKDYITQHKQQTDPVKNKMIDLLKVPWQRVIVDESHTFNNPTTLAFEGLYNIIETPEERPFVYLLSGTPVVYNVIDLTSQFRLMGFKLSNRVEFTEAIETDIRAKINQNQAKGKDPTVVPDAIDAMFIALDNEPAVPEAMASVPNRSNVPLWDQVGDMMKQVDSKVRSQVLDMIHQVEFDIFFEPDNKGNYFLNKEKLFGYFFQLFVDDTPMYQRGAAPEQQDIKIASISMTDDALKNPDRCLFDMLYPFMSVESTRGYNLPLETRRASPFQLHTEWLGTLDNDADNAPDTGDTVVDLADELFGRYVFYDQWKNQFIHSTLVPKYSLNEYLAPFTFALKDKANQVAPKPQKRTYDLKPAVRDNEDVVEDDDEEPLDIAAEDSEEEGENEAEQPVPIEPQKNYFIQDGRNYNRVLKLLASRGLAPPPALKHDRFREVIQILDPVMALTVLDANVTLPNLYKHIAPQHIRDIQMMLAYDWRLVNNRLYMLIIVAALRTALAIIEGRTKEYMPVRGIRQLLYRFWYVLGEDRLIDIAEVLIKNNQNLFDPVLYLVEQQASVFNLAPKKDPKLPHIAKFKPALSNPGTNTDNERIKDVLKNSHVMARFANEAEWYERTLAGQTLAQVKLILGGAYVIKGTPNDDKVIIYAHSDNLLSYIGILLDVYNVAKPYLLDNKTKLKELVKTAPGPGHFYVHAKSAYAGIENELISYFKFMPSVRILLITYNKGGVGLNLQVANHEIMLTSSLRYTEVRQARDRVYRNNQKKQVYIWNMLMAIHDDPGFHIPDPYTPPQAVKIQDGDFLIRYGTEDKPMTWYKEIVEKTWWHHVMYAIASRQANQGRQNREPTDPGQRADAIVIWNRKLSNIYHLFIKKRILPAHQLVTEAREQWQSAHSQFYPVHHLGNAVNTEQIQRLAFARAVFQHEVSVLLDLA